MEKVGWDEDEHWFQEYAWSFLLQNLISLKWNIRTTCLGTWTGIILVNAILMKFTSENHQFKIIKKYKTWTTRFWMVFSIIFYFIFSV